MLNFYKTIWAATWRQQLPLVALSIVVAALAAAPLKIQQLAINGLVKGETYQQLLLLCSAYLAVLLLTKALQFLRSYKTSILGEGVVRRIRERLYQRHSSDVAEGRMDIPKRGTLLSMITSDAKDIGNFTGSSISEPLLMLGTLVSVIGFIAVQQPVLGLIALAIILPQAFIVAAIQKHINRGVERRVQIVRRASDAINESTFREIDQGILGDFDEIFETQKKIIVFKLSSKFALKAITAIGTVGTLLLGGWLVIQGRTDVGTVVAALSGLSQISAPWLELVAFFRSVSTMRVRFDLIIDSAFPREGRRRASGRIRT